MEHKSLIDLGACAGARAWASNYPTLRDAWLACDRADWMLWLVAYTLPRERLVWVTCQIARTALGYVPVEEERPRAAIETAEAWTRGESTLEEVADVAYDASDAYDAYDAAASYDAADACDAARSAAAATSAAYAAAAAADAARACVRVRARACARACATAAALRIIRREIAWEEIEAALPTGPIR